MISEMERLILKADPILNMNDIVMASDHRGEPKRPANSKVSLGFIGSVDTESSSRKSILLTPTSCSATAQKPSGIKPPSSTRSGTTFEANSFFQPQDTKLEIDRPSDTEVVNKSKQNEIIDTQCM